MSATIIWFRQDLRLADHPALQWAIARGGPVLPVFIFDEGREGAWPLGGASRWWLHHSLQSLRGDLEARGSGLLLRRGAAKEILPELVRLAGAGAVCWSRRFEPSVVAEDAKVADELARLGCETAVFNSNLLSDPEAVATKTGGPYQVYTPYWRTLGPTISPRHLSAAPATFPPLPDVDCTGLSLDQFDLLPKPDWAAGMRATWQPGETGAHRRLAEFLARAEGYADQRDLPAVAGTSGLSPHLHWGEISPSRVWAQLAASNDLKQPGVETYCKELVWREFAHHLIHHFPHIPEGPLRKEFERFPWVDDPALLRAWQKGQTGIPIVDAGMRQLWQTGWMHNRVRMVVGSFLVKNLLQPWQQGAKWFWDTLVDADLASNTMGWQWVAGCGADAAPYFRIFNPVSQSEKFDPEGAYIRRFCPELAGLPAKAIHAPFGQPRAVLEHHGVRLGVNYPQPIVDISETRKAALAAYDRMRGK